MRCARSVVEGGLRWGVVRRSGSVVVWVGEVEMVVVGGGSRFSG